MTLILSVPLLASVLGSTSFCWLSNYKLRGILVPHQLMAHNTANVFSFTFKHNNHLCEHVSFSFKFYFSILTQGMQHAVTPLTPHIQSINTYFWDLSCDHRYFQSLLMSRQPSGHLDCYKILLVPHTVSLKPFSTQQSDWSYWNIDQIPWHFCW